ncbi:MAG: metal ABC transporter permease [Rhodospirillales bacterium]|nr:metal ABC transporter permease [Rhodospirillales bacterium]
MDDFLARALLAGLAVALATGPLGVFVVWRRMAYFGEALSNTALLGVALGFLLGVEPILGVAFVVVTAALILGALGGVRGISTDTLLGIVAHAALAAGLIVTATLQNVRVDLMAYLFGDILAVSWDSIVWLWGGAALILALILVLWRPLLNATVHTDLAYVEGVNVRRVELAFILMLALVVALTMKVVGILLVTSMLVIPAASARAFARTPETMAVLATLFGAVAVGLGLWASYVYDAPAGPAIVMVASVLFGLSLFLPSRN